MTESKSKKNIVATIIMDLSSKKDEEVLSALKKIPSKGNSAVIVPMIEAYIKSNNDKVKEKIQTILYELKDTTTIDALISCLNNGNDDVDRLILGALWNNNLNATEHLHSYVTASINGSYLTAFEGLTLIEALDGEFEEQAVMDSIFDLTEAIDKSNDEKTSILKTMLTYLAEMNQRI